MTEGYTAWHFDGKTAKRRSVTIDFISKDMLLSEQEQRHGPFPVEYLTYVGQQGGGDVYGLKGHDGWRLGIKGDVPAWIADKLPAKRRYGGWIDRLGLGPASLVFTGISAAVVAVVLFTPQWLAPIIPQSWERNFGDALVGDFGGRFCATDQGSKALKKMTDALEENNEDLQVEVANINMVNAIALPGGKVILFNGLLANAASADEVAGVLAHEIGHVRERHVMQALLRQMGLSIVLGGADGTGGQVVNGLLGSAYGRDAEREADSYSIGAMESANVSPVATAGFFERLSKIDGSAKADKNGRTITGYMSSHPLSSERKKAFEDSLKKDHTYTPILTPSEWSALKKMCAEDKDVEEGFGLFD